MTQLEADRTPETPRVATEGDTPEYVILANDESIERVLDSIPWAGLVFLHCDHQDNQYVLRYGVRPD